MTRRNHLESMDTNYFWESASKPEFSGSDSDPNELFKPQSNTSRMPFFLPPTAHRKIREMSEKMNVPIPEDLEWWVTTGGMLGPRQKYEPFNQ